MKKNKRIVLKDTKVLSLRKMKHLFKGSSTSSGAERSYHNNACKGNSFISDSSIESYRQSTQS